MPRAGPGGPADIGTHRVPARPGGLPDIGGPGPRYDPDRALNQAAT
ncbi:hypothetical protein [Streptomyces sp. NPDC012510]